MPRGSLPKVNRTTFSSTMPSATVAISQEFEPRRTKGRTATRSTTTPQARTAPGGKHRDRERPAQRDPKLKHSTAPSIMVPPCAKLTVLDTA